MDWRTSSKIPGVAWLSAASANTILATRSMLDLTNVSYTAPFSAPKNRNPGYYAILNPFAMPYLLLKFVQIIMGHPYLTT